MSKMLMYFVLFVLSCTVSSCHSQRTIIYGLDEREANEIIVFLASKDIEAQKIQAKSEGPGGVATAPTFDVAVDNARAVEAMSVLSANGLPRRRPHKLLELFSAGGLVPSEKQEKIRYEAGLAEQIGGTIRKIDGILDADVQLSFPEEDPLNPQNKKGAVTASVFIKHQGVLDDPNSQLVPKIRRLVASSVQGLTYDNVTVIADRGRFANPTMQTSARREGEGELVSVWSVAVAAESVGRFQTIFITAAVLIFISALCSLWLLWKILPVARTSGGIRSIFSLRPLGIPHGEELIEPSEEEEELPEGEGEQVQKGKKAQENIESS